MKILQRRKERERGGGITIFIELIYELHGICYFCGNITWRIDENSVVQMHLLWSPLSSRTQVDNIYPLPGFKFCRTWVIFQGYALTIMNVSQVIKASFLLFQDPYLRWSQHWNTVMHSIKLSLANPISQITVTVQISVYLQSFFFLIFLRRQWKMDQTLECLPALWESRWSSCLRCCQS